MTTQLFCSKCGEPYTPEKELFCTKCGSKLISSGSKRKLLEDVRDIESTPPVYETLRIISSLIIAIGWVVILVGWVFSLSVGALFGESVSSLFNDGGSSDTFKNTTILLGIISGFLFTGQGLFIIAAGQAIAVFLDIRTDTNITKRLIRRFGLSLME